MTLATIDVPVESHRPYKYWQLDCPLCNEWEYGRHYHKRADGSWHAPSTQGGIYVVRPYGDDWACQCKGFYHRLGCQHVSTVKVLESEGRTHNLPEETFVRYLKEAWEYDRPILWLRPSRRP